VRHRKTEKEKKKLQKGEAWEGAGVEIRRLQESRSLYNHSIFSGKKGNRSVVENRLSLYFLFKAMPGYPDSLLDCCVHRGN
jgi:hypothetical protein